MNRSEKFEMIGAVVGVIVGLWVSSIVGHTMLPEKWYDEWYAFPTMVTYFASIATFVIAGMYVGHRLGE